MIHEILSSAIPVLTYRKEFFEFCSEFLEKKYYTLDFVLPLRRVVEPSEIFLKKTKTFILDVDFFYDSNLELFCQSLENFINRVDRKCLKRSILIVEKFLPDYLLTKIHSACDCLIVYPCSKNLLIQKILLYKKNLALEDTVIPCYSGFRTENQNLLGFFGGTSEKIVKVRKSIEQASKVDTPVLLIGETGTGKTTAAKLIHLYSSRRNRPFVSLSIPMVPENLAESILFGTTKGSFTDALNKNGIVNCAETGTMFCDDADCSSILLQAKFLSFVESKISNKIGGNRENSDVRIIFATNADLKSLMEKGKFRSDLFFRLSENIIQIPPLRERPEDVEILVKEFFKNKEIIIKEEVIDALVNHTWKGNVRELHQCLGRILAKCETDTISIKDLDFGLFNEANSCR